jgi:hypothetical protein
LLRAPPPDRSRAEGRQFEGSRHEERAEEKKEGRKEGRKEGKNEKEEEGAF